MNISLSDVGSVQSAGEYPYQDGSITITVSEFAVWQANPDARFKLMRKHPIKGRIAYLLGEQVEQNPSRTLIYESDNGDVWCLTKDPVSGARAVMHRPNLQSGGRTSYINVEKFLQEAPEGPQHQALRNLLGDRA